MQVTATIPLSGSVSSPVDLRRGRLQAIFVPAITSGDLFVQGAFDTLSGGNSFARIMQPILDAQSSGDLRFGTSTGSRMIMWPDNVPSPSFVQLETSVPQGAARDFTIRFA